VPITKAAPRLLSRTDVAQMLGLSLRTVERMEEKGELPAPVRLGRLVRFRASDIERYISRLRATERTAAAR